MSDTLVTVVIPVYNVEKYLDRCVGSVVAQTYRDLEIILVDDGSPDRCPQLCDEWAAKDSRIRVIHKENQGLGMARNTGIDCAAGAYICFFDSDDYIAPNTIELAYKLARRERAEFVIFGMTNVDRDGKVTGVCIPAAQRRGYAGPEVQQWLLPEMLGPDPATGQSAEIPPSACCMMFSADLIRRANWRFASERQIISEDIYSLLGLYAHVSKAALLPEPLYFYCENDASLSHSYRPDRYAQNKQFYEKCVELCRVCGYSDTVIRRCAEPFLRNTIAAMKQEVAHHDRRTALLRLRGIIDDELLQKVLREKRCDKTNLKKRILFLAMGCKQYHLCYVLLAAKNAAAKK